jgi:hypothetical protein
LNAKVNDLAQELLTKLDNLQKWTDKKISIAFIKIAEKFDELVRKVG